MRAPLLLLVLVSLVAGCATNDDADTTPTPTTPTAAATAKAVAVELFDQTPGVGVPPTTMGIDPATLELAAGQLVNLTITNAGETEHDFVIDGLDVDTDNIPPGESLSIEFTPTEAGSYKMYCSLGSATPASHDTQGMHGEIVVS